MTGDRPRRGPRLRVPPPAIFIILFLVGLLLESFARLPIVGPVRAPLLGMLGMAVIGLGFFLMVWGAATFWRHGTTVLPYRAASTLVRTGPYRFTRNPMYVGMTTVHIGTALMMNVAWPLILLPLALYLVVRLVIRLEEAHLAEVFGAEYEEFKRRVRRWL